MGTTEYGKATRRFRGGASFGNQPAGDLPDSAKHGKVFRETISAIELEKCDHLSTIICTHTHPDSFLNPSFGQRRKCGCLTLNDVLRVHLCVGRVHPRCQTGSHRSTLGISAFKLRMRNDWGHYMRVRKLEIRPTCIPQTLQSSSYVDLTMSIEETSVGWNGMCEGKFRAKNLEDLIFTVPLTSKGLWALLQRRYGNERSGLSQLCALP
ncbi:hypothetical protein LXA43DRAFT_574441 [Ganoderma leucocontextum]|nr:hypothetical protein LXA43DRAFT_574441 [Ganoderma leucocontextum]